MAHVIVEVRDRIVTNAYSDDQNTCVELLDYDVLGDCDDDCDDEYSAEEQLRVQRLEKEIESMFDMPF